MDPRARACLERSGIPASRHRARPVTLQQIERADVVVALDRSVLDALVHLTPPDLRSRLALLLDFSPSHPGEDVPDPYFGPLSGFDDVLALCDEGIRGLLTHLTARQPPLQAGGAPWWRR